MSREIVPGSRPFVRPRRVCDNGADRCRIPGPQDGNACFTKKTELRRVWVRFVNLLTPLGQSRLRRYVYVCSRRPLESSRNLAPLTHPYGPTSPKTRVRKPFPLAATNNSFYAELSRLALCLFGFKVLHEARKSSAVERIVSEHFLKCRTHERRGIFQNLFLPSQDATGSD